MGALKEFFHEEITNGIFGEMDAKDIERAYDEKMEEKNILERAEQDEFNRVFEATHTYPM